MRRGSGRALPQIRGRLTVYKPRPTSTCAPRAVQLSGSKSRATAARAIRTRARSGSKAARAFEQPLGPVLFGHHIHFEVKAFQCVARCGPSMAQMRAADRSQIGRCFGRARSKKNRTTIGAVKITVVVPEARERTVRAERNRSRNWISMVGSSIISAPRQCSWNASAPAWFACARDDDSLSKPAAASHTSSTAA